jgi:hypothetical protein
MPIASWSASLGAIDRRQVFNAQVQAAAPNANPQLAQGVVAQANAYPWMAPQTALALTQNGAQPGDPVSQAVATASLNKKGGGFWHSFGHIVDAGARAAIHLGSDVQGAGKVAARAAFTGLNTLYEVPMAGLRDVAAVGGDIAGGAASGALTGLATGAMTFTPWGALGGLAAGAVVGGVAGALAQSKGVQVQGNADWNLLNQSAGGLALQKLATGNAGDIDLGTGFMPGGQLSAQATKNAQAAANINGHALTPGRMLASGVWRPGTGGYNVLSGVVDGIDRWELDPGRYAGEELGAQVRAAKVIPGAVRAVDESGAAAAAGPITKLLTRAGVLDAADPAFNAQVARDFLTTDPAARNFVAKATVTDSAYDIRRATNGKLPSALLNELAAHTDEQDVVNSLLNHMESQGLRDRAAVQSGRGIMSSVPSFRPPARLAAVYDRISSVMPAHSVDLRDVNLPGGAFKLDNAVDQMDNLLTQARYTAEQKAPILNRLMATTTADEAKQVITDTVHSDLRQRLLDLGMSEDKVQGVLKTSAADRNALLSQVHSEVAGGMEQQSLFVGDDHLPLNKASDVLQADATHVQLPDGRDIRRMTTPSDRLRSIYNSKAFLETEHAADYFMGAWKKLNLQRIALPLRMIAMSQAKMAANGLEVPLSDPMTVFSTLVGRAARPGALEGMVEGSPLSQAEEMMKFSRRLSGHLSADDVTPFQQTLRPGDEGFARSWAARVAEHHADPVARSIATDGAESTVQSLWNGALKDERLRLAEEENLPELGSQEGVRQHVATLADNLRAVTANNPELIDSVATGRLVGVDLLKAHPGGLVNPDLETALQRIVDNPDVEVPNVMKAAKPHEIDPDYGNKVGRVSQWFYSRLGNSMDALVNHPAFNQLYWQGVADHASMLDEDGRAVLRARLADDTKAVRMPGETQSSILATLDRTATPGAVTFDDVDKLARAQATQRLQDMTIDMSKKQGWQDAMRHVIPFAKHWQQETGQWARLLTAHPEAFEKAQMAVHGAEGNGWFHKNAQGSLVFNYPGSGLVSRVLTGVDMPITGKVGGVSTMTTELMPGFGPMVSISASKLLPNKPQFDAIRDFFSPYGDPTQQGVVASVLPPWAKTLQAALSDPNNDRDAANTTMEVARYLVSTGKFSMDSPENITKTLDEAGSRARRLLELQAMGKFVLPASPSLEPKALVKAMGDKDGRSVVARTLSDDLIQMRKENYDTSTQRFLEKYGDNALLFLQSASRPIAAGAASTKEQEDFARANPELAKAFPNSYAFFAPQGGQTPDFTTITRQIHAGERQALSPAQQVALANDQVGSMIYYQAKAKLGPRISDPQQQWLNTLKQALIEQYPGFAVPVAGVAARVTDTTQGVQDVVLPEVRRALDNPKMAATATGQALSQYLELRDGIDQIAQGRGLKPNAFAQAAHADDLRAVLNKAALILGQDNPGFSMLFDRLLSRELRTDVQPEAAPTSA